MRKTVIAGLIFLAACATKPTPKETSAATLVDRSGDSVETAVRLREQLDLRPLRPLPAP